MSVNINYYFKDISQRSICTDLTYVMLYHYPMFTLDTSQVIPLIQKVRLNIKQFNQYNKLIFGIENGIHKTRQYQNKKAPQFMLDERFSRLLDVIGYSDDIVKEVIKQVDPTLNNTHDTYKTYWKEIKLKLNILTFTKEDEGELVPDDIFYDSDGNSYHKSGF